MEVYDWNFGLIEDSMKDKWFIGLTKTKYPFIFKWSNYTNRWVVQDLRPLRGKIDCWQVIEIPEDYDPCLALLGEVNGR